MKNELPDTVPPAWEEVTIGFWPILVLYAVVFVVLFYLGSRP